MNTIQVQREQRRDEARRAAEWADDLASACDWFIEQITALDPSTEARRVVAHDLTEELGKWAATVRQSAVRNRERAETIGATLAAAARPQPNRGGAL